MIAYPLFMGWSEALIILLIAVLLFGAKKIPELMKGVGKGVRSFKEGLNEIDDQINQSDNSPKQSAKPSADAENSKKED